MPRAIRFSEKRKTELLRVIEEAWTNTKSDWSQWVYNMARWRKAYQGILTTKNDPWPGCSNLSIPITPLAVERTHSTLMGVIDQENLIGINPTEYADVSRAANLEKFANHAFFNKMKAPKIMDRWAHKTCMFGLAPAVTVWRRDQKKERETYTVRKSELSRGKGITAICEWFFQDDLIEAGKKCRYRDQKRGVDRDATIYILDDDEREDPSDDEIEFEVTTTTVRYEGPAIELPAPEDCLPSADGQTPYEAKMHFYTIWTTMEELEQRHKSNYYDISKDLMEQLHKDYGGDDTADENFVSDSAKTYTDEVATVRTSSARRRGKFVVQKVFMPWDADEDGELDDCVFTVLWDSGSRPHLIRADYRRNIWSHGDLPITYNEFIYLDDVPVAIGVPQYLSALQAEINTLHNQVVDANSIRNNPWFAYRSGSNLTPASIKMQPGRGVPMDNPGDIWMPTFQNNSVSDLQTIQSLQEFAERLVPHGDVAMGRSAGGNRTAGGMAMIVQQSNEVWAKYVTRFGSSVERVAGQALQLYGANMPAWLEFRVTGSNDLVRIDRDSLREGYDFTVRASMLLANKEIQRSYALQRFQLLAQHPMYQSEEKQWVLISDLLKSQDVRDIPRHLGPEPEKTRHPYLSPAQEHTQFAQGIAWEPHGDENHEQHLQEHQIFDAMYGDVLQGKGRKLLRMHMQHHDQLMGQAKRQQQMAMQGVEPQVGADFGQTGGTNPMMNSVQQQPGAMQQAGEMSANA